MDALRLGPLLLPAGPLLLIAGYAAAVTVAGMVRRRGYGDAAPAVLWLLLAGLVVGRLVFVLHWRQEVPNLIAVLDIRDRGVDPWAAWGAGVFAAALWAWRRAQLRRGLAAALGAGAAVWLGGSALLHALQPAPVQLPQLTLRDLSGRAIAVQQWRGRPLVINLWATWCPPCRRELPVLLHAAHDQKATRIVLADQGESPQAVRQMLQSLGARDEGDAVVLDTQRALAAHYGVPGYPTTLFIRADGSLERMYVGELSAATLQQGVESLQAGGR